MVLSGGSRRRGGAFLSFRPWHCARLAGPPCAGGSHDGVRLLGLSWIRGVKIYLTDYQQPSAPLQCLSLLERGAFRHPSEHQAKDIAMPRTPKAPANPIARPTEFSEDVLTRVVQQYQGGKSLYQIADDPTLPSYSLLATWRHTRPDFFQILKTCDEDRQRAALADMQEIATKVKGIVMGMTPEEVAAHPVLLAAALSAYDKLARAPALAGDEPPPLPEEEDQRRCFDDLHPVTQSAIRQALTNDARLRGEEQG